MNERAATSCNLQDVAARLRVLLMHYSGLPRESTIRRVMRPAILLGEIHAVLTIALRLAVVVLW